MKYNKFLFLILLLLVTAAGCSKDKDKNVDEVEIIEVPEPPSDPEPLEPPQNVGDFYKSFIGQWQEIARGNEYYPELNPSGRVIEFFEDGTSNRYYDLISIYRADAEFLYFHLENGSHAHTDRHTFTGTDTLRLDYVDGAKEDSMWAPTFRIYKRLK